MQLKNRYIFNRLEFSGSLGDIGTLLPLAIGLILVNGLNPSGILISIGLFYVLSGIYFNVTVPVQPMKVISAYAIATTLTPSQIMASSMLMGIILLITGGTNAITLIGKYVPKSVVRGVQLSTGTILMVQGIKFMLGSSTLQLLKNIAEPYLTYQFIGGVPIGIIIGIIGTALTLLFIDNKKMPAGLIIISSGLLLGLSIGTGEGLSEIRPGFFFPTLFPFSFPVSADFMTAFFILVLPQLPMTFGNAVIANADLSKEYFGENSKKVTYKALTISMGLANLLNFLFGGMPLCHGAGGLAAHYRFGARTAGSNLMIGGIFLFLALFLGDQALSVIYLIPLAILGVLLLFAGSQLAITIIDLDQKKELFVALVMLGITIASNLAAGFIIGMLVSYTIKYKKINI